jgi:hypothetical protein
MSKIYKPKLAPALAFEKNKKTKALYANGYSRNRTLPPEAVSFLS